MPPPYFAARYGNLQIFPSPTDAPAADRTYPSLPEKLLLLLCSIFSLDVYKRQMMIGAGIGIVIRAGASTGGMDIPPLILKKLFHLPISATLYVFDFSILILQMFFSDIEESLYGILLVMIYTFVLDKVLVIGTHQARADIVSSHYEEIRQAIFTRLDRGCTLLNATTRCV